MGFQSAEGMQESVPVLLLADLECTEGARRRPCKESAARGLSSFGFQGEGAQVLVPLATADRSLTKHVGMVIGS